MTTRSVNRKQQALFGAAAIAMFAGLMYATAMSPRAAATATQYDDIYSVLRQYSIAIHQFDESNADERARQQFYIQWLTTLLNECEMLPPGEVPDSARMTCLSLANGLGDYALAEAIATDGVLLSSDWQQQLAFWDQRVGLRQAIAAETGRPQDLADIRARAVEALAAIRPTLGQSLYAQDAVSTLSVQRILRVAAERAAADGDTAQAAALLEESGVFASGLPSSTLQEIGYFWWADQCLQDAARYRIEDEDIPAAIHLLRQIDGLALSRTTSGEHALLCAGDAIPAGRFERGFARGWLAQARPWGAAEIRMAYALAFSLSQSPPTNDQQRLDEAAGLLEELLALPASLAEADAAVSGPLLASGQPDDNWVIEPIRSNALVTLASVYSALGMRDESAVIAGMVVVDYPKHPAVSLMEAMLD